MIYVFTTGKHYLVSLPILKTMLKDVVSATGADVSKVTREIFFIDDDEEELLIFQLALKDSDISFNLHYAKSGDVFFNILEQKKPDLIFLDLHMPGKSGITVLKMLRYNEKYKSIPIIIYSKLNNPTFINDCYLAKANYYLIKPVSIKKLTKALHKIIDSNWDAGNYPSRENFVIEE
ncbi:MAG: response regulator [Chitinophagaceae bacterium]